MKRNIKALAIVSFLLVYNICTVSQMHAGPSMVPVNDNQDDDDNGSSNNESNNNESNDSGNNSK